ncbi:hypothetical protein [Streptomyces sp. NBC_01198]|uniref:hypothetical protein n=1 Tax=Streptomyces sp. NBC_01198 TaxID=2903769 RepID=UPI002E10E331|nr:hypothetical protein OG702_32185 [Streptomyces sp. NBC_01198]
MDQKKVLYGIGAGLALVLAAHVGGSYKVVHTQEAAKAKPRVTSTATPAHGIPKTVKVPSVKLPTKACGDDVTRNCFHDAARSGDGRGYSYWVDAVGWVTYLDPKKNDTAQRLAWGDDKKAAGWVAWGAYDGHQDCYAKVGDTTYIVCWDDFHTTS